MVSMAAPWPVRTFSPRLPAVITAIARPDERLAVDHAPGRDVLRKGSSQVRAPQGQVFALTGHSVTPVSATTADTRKPSHLGSYQEPPGSTSGPGLGSRVWPCSGKAREGQLAGALTWRAGEISRGSRRPGPGRRPECQCRVPLSPSRCRGPRRPHDGFERSRFRLSRERPALRWSSS